MKYYVIAGEASGDLHGSNLLRELRKQDPNAEFRCWGGDLMEAQGGEIVKHYKDLAFMGFIEVVVNLGTILMNISFCKQDIKAYRPDAVILIDYPGFNLRIAEFVSTLGVKVLYYISPQVWAWKKSRVHKIKKYVDAMYVILPFEKDFYRSYDYDVEFVGHPLIDAISHFDEAESLEAFKSENKLDDRPIVALLPGSRVQEIEKILPNMIALSDWFPSHQFVIAASPSQKESLYKNMIGDRSIKMVINETYRLLSISAGACVTSGTATLETALFNVPQVVCYKGSSISYQIAKRLIKVNYISLVNLIMERRVVKELIQSEYNVDNLRVELGSILNDEKHIEKMKSDYKDLVVNLGGEGASTKTALSMLKTLRS